MLSRSSFRRRGFIGAIALALVACAGATTETKPPPPPPVSLTFPSIVIPAGVEDTQCVVLRLPNDKPLRVGAIHNTLGLGSHHLIVYRVTDAEEKPTPFECQPFTDTLDPTKGSTIMVTQKADDLLTLPTGVAFSIEAHQMIRLEMHYVNPSQAERSITASSTFIPIAEEDFKDDADFLFIGNPDIRIEPHSKWELGPTFFQPPVELADVKYFAMTGHQHHLGTNVRVALAESAADPGRMIYDVPDWSWSEPKTERFETPLVLSETAGFKFTCSWNNTTDKRITFGESVDKEMCFFWAYYYPSRGAKVCLHTKRVVKEGSSLCCPGHPLCGLVDELDR